MRLPEMNGGYTNLLQAETTSTKDDSKNSHAENTHVCRETWDERGKASLPGLEIQTTCKPKKPDLANSQD